MDMPEWLAITFGVAAGTLIVGCALAWAVWPRRPGKRSRLASPSDPGVQYEAQDIHPPAN